MRTAAEIERTKETLRDALFELMAETDYQSITMSDISQRAGFGRATLYRHFQSKEDIVRYYFEKNSDLFSDLKHISLHSEDDFYEIIFRVFSALKENRELIGLLMKARIEFMYLEFMNNALVDNFKKNGFISNKYAPYYFMGSLFNVSMEWVRNGCEESVKQMADFYYEHLFLTINKAVEE